MNINNARNSVIKGNVATYEMHILTWELLGESLDINVSNVTSALNDAIKALEKQLT